MPKAWRDTVSPPTPRHFTSVALEKTDSTQKDGGAKGLDIGPDKLGLGVGIGDGRGGAGNTDCHSLELFKLSLDTALGRGTIKDGSSTASSSSSSRRSSLLSDGDINLGLGIEMTDGLGIEGGVTNA